MLNDNMDYLTPPPTPFFKREVPLIEDEETRRKHEEEFVNQIIETCEKLHIKDAFVSVATIGLLEQMWWGHQIAESKNEDE